MALKEEEIIVEEKKATTQALIESIGREKAVVDEAVEIGRGDEEAAARLQARAVLGLCMSESALTLTACIHAGGGDSLPG